MGAMTGPGGAAGEASPGSPVEGLIAATRHATQALRQALITTRGIVPHHLRVVPDWRWVIDEGHFLSGPTQALAGRGQLQHSGIAAPLAARPSGCWSRQVGGGGGRSPMGPSPGVQRLGGAGDGGGEGPRGPGGGEAGGGRIGRGVVHRRAGAAAAAAAGPGRAQASRGAGDAVAHHPPPFPAKPNAEMTAGGAGLPPALPLPPGGPQGEAAARGAGSRGGWGTAWKQNPSVGYCGSWVLPLLGCGSVFRASSATPENDKRNTFRVFF